MRTAKLPYLLALALGLALWPSGGASSAEPRAPSPDAAGEIDTLVATVQSVNFQAETLDVLTGCGHALRTVRISVTPETKITRTAGSAGLSDLKPDLIVRIRFRRVEARNVAQSIEVTSPRGER